MKKQTLTAIFGLLLMMTVMCSVEARVGVGISVGGTVAPRPVRQRVVQRVERRYVAPPVVVTHAPAPIIVNRAPVIVEEVPAPIIVNRAPVFVEEVPVVYTETVIVQPAPYRPRSWFSFFFNL